MFNAISVKLCVLILKLNDMTSIGKSLAYNIVKTVIVCKTVVGVLSRQKLRKLFPQMIRLICIQIISL